MKDIDYNDLYGVRVLVFMEAEPQSNQYHQVLLTPEIYKEMTATICRVPANPEMIRDGVEARELKTSEEIYTLLDLSEAYLD